MEEYSFSFSTGSSVEEGSTPVIDSVSVAPDNTVLVGETVTVSAAASDADGDALEYRFRQSTDASYTAWSSSSSTAFTYAETGTYTVNVQVRDPSGLRTAATANVAVIEDVIASEPSLNSSRLALSLDGGFVWAVNPDNDSVARVSVTNGNLLGEHLIGDEPFSVAVDDIGRAWVALRKEDTIAIVDESGNPVQSIDLGYGAAPTAIVMDRAGETAYVALYNEGAIVKFDTSTLEEQGRVEGLTKPYALALTGSGDQLLATRLISQLSSGEVYRVSTGNMTLADTITLQTSMEEDDIDNGRGVPNHLAAIIIDDADANAYVVGKKDNYGAGLANDNADIDDDNTVRTFAARIDLASGTELREERIDFDNADSPSALALSSNGEYLFVALQGNNQVALITRDQSTGQLGSVANSLTVGTAPRGLLFDAATEQLFVKNFTARSLSTVDASGILLGNIANPTINTTVTVTNETLAEQVLWGKSLFYNASYGLNEDGEFTGKTSAEGYMSCATCHLDGGQDGTTYDFTGRGEGIRNNISLYGRGGTRFGNVHWSGNFDEIHDFEGDMRNAFKGRGLMDDSDFTATEDPLGPTKEGRSIDLDAMSAYVSSLGKASLPRSPHRDSIGELTEAGLAGQQVFADLGCSDCHRGSAFTDGAIHDIGTTRSHSGGRLGGDLEGIITPTLLSVFDSPPYLHDGSAQTLEEVFSVMGGEVYQAEEAQRSAGAVLRSPQFAYMRGGQGVRIGTSDSITFEVQSTAHDGSIRIRYGSVGSNMDLVLTVNGTTYRRPITRLGRVDGIDVSFLEATYSVTLADGTNTLVITVESGNGTGSTEANLIRGPIDSTATGAERASLGDLERFRGSGSDF
jgi:DNA-binding beta-propeller fold protein YncE